MDYINNTPLVQFANMANKNNWVNSLSSFVYNVVKKESYCPSAFDVCSYFSWKEASPPKWLSTSLFDDFFI